MIFILEIKDYQMQRIKLIYKKKKPSTVRIRHPCALSFVNQKKYRSALSNPEARRGTMQIMKFALSRHGLGIGWLVGCFEDKRRFSDLSVISRLGSRR